MHKSFRLFALFPLLLLMGNQGCDIDIGNPQSIGQKVQSSMTPYFADSHTIMLPKTEIIAVVTCLYGTGPSLVNEIAGVVQSKPELRQLKMLRNFRGSIAKNSYRYVELVFPDQVIVYDVDSGETAITDNPKPMRDIYSTACSSDFPAVAIKN